MMWQVAMAVDGDNPDGTNNARKSTRPSEGSDGIYYIVLFFFPDMSF